MTRFYVLKPYLLHADLFLTWTKIIEEEKAAA